MELTTRAAAGTLSELLGPGLLESDRESRAMGLAWAADRKYGLPDSASLGYRALAAYADGVNAWIDNLKASDLPLEYRLLGRKPSRWEAKHLICSPKWDGLWHPGPGGGTRGTGAGGRGGR
jgi:penicillin amidase